MAGATNLRKATYRLYPTPKQAAAMMETLRSHQQLYNAALEERIDCYRKTGRSLSYADQCRSLTFLRSEMSEWSSAANCSSQQLTLRRLDKAFAVFFRRVNAGDKPGFPRFKSLNRCRGFGFKIHGDGFRFTPGKDWKHGSLRLSGIGQISARARARQGGDIRSSQILHRAGKWYLSLTVDTGQPQRGRTEHGAIALDFCDHTFLTGVTQTGDVLQIGPVPWRKADQDLVAELQQAVSRKANKLSNRRRLVLQRLAAARAKTARRHLDWMHKLSAQLASRYALVAAEALSSGDTTPSASRIAQEPGSSVAQKSGLHRSILNTAPALFTSLLRCKVLETGGEWVEAPTRKLKPSQRCPQCWATSIEQRSDSMHRCNSCGYTAPRRIASSSVVLRWALQPGINGQELADADLKHRKTYSLHQHRAG